MTRLWGHRSLRLLVAWLWTIQAQAQPAPPATLAPVAASAPDLVALGWPPVTGAATYNVKRSLTPGGPHTLLANIAATNYTDPTALPGTHYFYAITTVSNSVESTAFREVQAVTVLIGDNSDGSGVVLTGAWTPSAVSGFYGVDSVFASRVTGETATATCTDAPTLTVTANYDSAATNYPARFYRVTMGL